MSFDGKCRSLKRAGKGQLGVEGWLKGWAGVCMKVLKTSFRKMRKSKLIWCVGGDSILNMIIKT